MSDLVARFREITAFGRPKPLDELDEPEETAVNVLPEDVNAGIRTIMLDDDHRTALFDVIDTMARESNALMGMGRKDHTDMLFHHGGYARLQELKAELIRLAGLTG